MSQTSKAIGFRYHQKTLRRFLGLFLTCLFGFVMFTFPTVQHGRAGTLHGGMAVSLFLVLAFCLLGMGIAGIMLSRVLRGLYVLEFGPLAIIDRRFLKKIVIPYEKIEIFSPTLDDIFRPDPRLRALRDELDMNDKLMVSCRLKPGHGLKAPGVRNDCYFFSEYVRPFAVSGEYSAAEFERCLRVQLEPRIETFEQLFEIEIE